MPEPVAELEHATTAVGAPDPVLDGEVGDVGNLRAMPQRLVLAVDADGLLVRAEQAREGQVLFLVQRLAREDEHRVVRESRADLPLVLGRQRPGQVDTADLGDEALRAG